MPIGDQPAVSMAGTDEARRDELVHALEHAAHLLPSQPPLHAFVHHNTLHAFEGHDFDDALREASALYGTEPYQSEQAFAGHLASGRIDSRDIESVLAREPGGEDRLWPGGPLRSRLWRFRLRHAFETPAAETVAWMVSEGELFADSHAAIGVDARARALTAAGSRRRLSLALRELWQTFAAVAPPAAEARRGVRRRDALLAVSDIDIDEWVQPLLIRLAGAFLDQGMAAVGMPHRGAGFLAAVRALYAPAGTVGERWMGGLKAVVCDHARRELDALDTIAWALEAAAIPRAQWPGYVLHTLLALKGWAGMFHQYETHPERLPVRPVPATLADFLAVQLTLETVATRYALARADAVAARGTAAVAIAGLLEEAADARPARADLGAVFEAFVVAQGLGLDAEDLADDARARALMDAVRAFDGLTRRRLLHAAYEHHYRVHVLDSLIAHQPYRCDDPQPPALQAVFCMDEREESLRRHLEELSPDVQTFGYAGFFGVAMSYRGLDDVKERPLCPVVVTPRHLVEELPLDAGAHARYQLARRRRGRASNFVRTARDDALRGSGWALLVGTLKIVPLIGCSLFPRAFARLMHRLHELGPERPHTRLRVEGSGAVDPATGLIVGYTVAEMTDIVHGMLSTMGLARDFAPIVLIVGHGSSSLNNPHEAAHDCGATGGGRGGPNARAFAVMANHPEVRARLAGRGLVINQQTWFVGAYHNTCDDAMTCYDTDLVPASHRTALERTRERLAAACTRDAHERCRRFESAPAMLGIDAAMHHAEEHATDLGQPRPEYGHATNAVCVIGRRRSTRGLFLDRRAFLISYDPLDDVDGEKLGALLAAAAPVGAGISLEYYFSYVDPRGYGCGTKLPHNITGLIGVVDGHASDLRTGLPWQMVEIHEPMRLLTVVEATTDMLEHIVATHPGVAALVLNRWIQLVAVDPHTGAVQVFDDGRFVPYTPHSRDLLLVESSMDHYAGRRGHLPCARVRLEVEHAA